MGEQKQTRSASRPRVLRVLFFTMRSILDGLIGNRGFLCVFVSPRFWGIGRTEATIMDPQHRVFMEVAAPH